MKSDSKIAHDNSAFLQVPNPDFLAKVLAILDHVRDGALHVLYEVMGLGYYLA
jgi:hypothetical protein